MLRAEYNSLIYAYESNHQDILNIYNGGLIIANEANTINNGSSNSASSTASVAGTTATKTADKVNDASSAVSDTVKSTENKTIDTVSVFKKVSERVKELIKKIGEMLSSLMRKVQNRLRLLNETDKGFFNMYYKRKSMVKPYKAVKVITYTYNNSILSNTLERLVPEINLCLKKFKLMEGTTNNNGRVSDIISSNSKEMLEKLYEPYCKGTKVSNTQEFIKYIVSQFRGEKKELVYKESDLPKIEQYALSTKQISTKCNNYIKIAQESYNEIKAIEYVVGKNSKDTKVLQLISNNTMKAATLYNALTTIIKAYYELCLEQSLNYRIILKKFYQF